MDLDRLNRIADERDRRNAHRADHEHEYDDATGRPCVCPVYGCWFNDAPCDLPDGMVQDALFEGE